jgi:phage baseplate assembly protein V
MLIGNIVDVNKSLVRVKYQDTITNFIPYLQYANSFKTQFKPPRIGEQVLILSSAGGLKVALGAIFSSNYPEPTSSQTKELTLYEDGAIISYDTSTSTLEVLNQKDINIVVNNSVNITAPNVNINASSSVVATTPVFSISGSLNVGGGISGGAKGGGGLSIIGNANIRGDISINGNISDSRGDLTGHSHSDSDGYTSNPR